MTDAPGNGHGHGHGRGDGHGHEVDATDLPSELVELLSVGVDIGSATSQVLFSRIRLRRLGGQLSTRYVVVGREVLGGSGVHLTPYGPGATIAADELTEMVATAYRDMGLRAEDVDTGAVILTGEAVRRENARAIGDALAVTVGEFVCATAGHAMEATLAAHGCGAVGLSQRSGLRILTVDVGGGTTKLADVEHGRIRSVAAVHVGGRLAAFEDGRIVRLEPGGRRLAELAGVDWELGGPAGAAEIVLVTGLMARIVADAVLGGEVPAGVALTAPLGTDAGTPFDAVMFSGGVAEYVHGRETRDHGDLGMPLAAALRSEVAQRFPWPLREPDEGMCATVIGASQYTVQVSGNTIYVSDPSQLPRRNLRVLRPPLDLPDEIDPADVGRRIVAHRAAFEAPDEGDGAVTALALTWGGTPSHRRIAALARGIGLGMRCALDRGDPLYLVIDGDIGGTLGSVLHEELLPGAAIVAVDGIALADFEFVDIGRVQASGSVPVTVKSLVFDL